MSLQTKFKTSSFSSSCCLPLLLSFSFSSPSLHLILSSNDTRQGKVHQLHFLWVYDGDICITQPHRANMSPSLSLKQKMVKYVVSGNDRHKLFKWPERVKCLHSLLTLPLSENGFHLIHSALYFTPLFYEGQPLRGACGQLSSSGVTKHSPNTNSPINHGFRSCWRWTPCPSSNWRKYQQGKI